MCEENRRCYGIEIILRMDMKFKAHLQGVLSNWEFYFFSYSRRGAVDISKLSPKTFFGTFPNLCTKVWRRVQGILLQLNITLDTFGGTYSSFFVDALRTEKKWVALRHSKYEWCFTDTRYLRSQQQTRQLQLLQQLVVAEGRQKFVVTLREGK